MSRRCKPIPKLDRDVSCYLAGLMDGEGCLMIQRQRKHGPSPHWCYSPEVRLVLSHKETMEWVAKKIDRELKAWVPKSDKHKLCYRLSISDSVGVAYLIEQLLPFLIVKRDAAAALLDFCRSRKIKQSNSYNPSYSDDEVRMHHVIRALNRKGRPVVSANFGGYAN